MARPIWYFYGSLAPHLKRIPKVTRSAKLCNRFNGDFHAHINGKHKRHVIGKARDINEAQTIELGRELKQRVDYESMIKRQAKSAAALKTHLKITKPRPKLEFFSNVADAEKFVLALSEYWSLLTTLPWTQDNHQRDLKHETLKLLLLQIILPHTLSDLLTLTCTGTFENGVNAWKYYQYSNRLL